VFVLDEQGERQPEGAVDVLIMDLLSDDSQFSFESNFGL
jgi:hypothetical protein